MSELEVDFIISQGQHFDCSFEIYAAGATFSNIEGNPYDNVALAEALNDKANVSTVEALSETVDNNYNTLDDKIDSTETALEDEISALETDLNDKISNEQSARIEADNTLQGNIDTLDGKIDTHIADKTNPHEVTKTQVGLGNVDNTSDLNKPISTATQTALNGKQNTISDLSEIRSNASNGQSAYNTIQNYGDIVTYDVSDFATNLQGQKADTALQPNDDITELNNNAGYITSASLPTVNNNKITIQKNSIDVGSFTLNQSIDKTINLPIPTEASDINAVPTSRKVNNKALSSDITLSASDVSALPSLTTINDLTTSTQQDALNSGATSINIGQIATNTSDITAIEGLIPVQATTTNQLADKSFVNSSIATNTAYFIGTFNSLADLEAYSGTLTNNDYAFVETTDSAGNTLYDRYKYTTATTPASWQFEYELNNSSFTSNQWASINSGITANDVTLIGTAIQPNDNVSSLTNDAGYITSSSLPTVNNGTLTIQQNGTDVQTFTANQSTNVTANITVPTKTSDLTNNSGFIDNSALSSYATQTDLTNGLATKQDTISDLSTIRSNATNGQSAYTTIGGYGDIVTYDASDFVKKSGGSSTQTIALTSGTGTTPISIKSMSTSSYISLSGTNGWLGSYGVSSSKRPVFYNGIGYTIAYTSDIPDVQINGTSIAGQGVANIITNSAYNASSNKIATMSDLPADEIFIATYNTTTFNDILAAYLAGKTILCEYNYSSTTKMYLYLVEVGGLSSSTAQGFVFSKIENQIENIAVCDISNGWSYTSTGLQPALTAVTHTANTNVGTGKRLVYVNSSGVATASTSTVGDDSTPVYLSSGIITSTGKSIASSRFDGQWVQKESVVQADVTAINSYSFSLTTYLPSDSINYNYEILVNIYVNSSNNTQYYVGTSASPQTNKSTCFWTRAVATGNARAAQNFGILPISRTNRYIYTQIYNAAASSGCGCTIIGYRRIGTNS